MTDEHSSIYTEERADGMQLVRIGALDSIEGVKTVDLIGAGFWLDGTVNQWTIARDKLNDACHKLIKYFGAPGEALAARLDKHAVMLALTDADVKEIKDAHG
jgi:hypothetical protein